MGWVEQAWKHAKNAPSDSLIEKLETERNTVIRSFTSKDIEIKELKAGLEPIEQVLEKYEFHLPWPGPLNGLLMDFKVDKKERDRISYEERGHCVTARKEGVYDDVRLTFTTDDESGTLIVRARIAYDIPDDVSDDEMRRKIEKISLAIPQPSPDDLAKLPEHMR